MEKIKGRSISKGGLSGGESTSVPGLQILGFTISSHAKAAFKYKGLEQQIKQRCLGKTTWDNEDAYDS